MKDVMINFSFGMMLGFVGVGIGWLIADTAKGPIQIEPDLIYQSPDTKCHGYHTEDWDTGSAPIVWMCSDGRVVYDETGVRSPMESSDE